MKNKLSLLILISAPLFSSCNGTVNEKNETFALANAVSIKQKYTIDTKESVIKWQGSNLMGANPHDGYIYISKGELIIENGELTGGAVEVDMNTIEDQNHQSGDGLVKHLKDPDFFDVERFPFARIVLSKAPSIKGGNKNITGNLTIKGITQPVIFTAETEVKNGIVKMNGKLAIDRTLWDIRYKSGKFYDNLADETISDYIKFDIKIVAKK